MSLVVAIKNCCNTFNLLLCMYGEDDVLTTALFKEKENKQTYWFQH